MTFYVIILLFIAFADCLSNGTLITFLRQLREGYINISSCGVNNQNFKSGSSRINRKRARELYCSALYKKRQNRCRRTRAPVGRCCPTGPLPATVTVVFSGTPLFFRGISLVLNPSTSPPTTTSRHNHIISRSFFSLRPKT